MQKAGAFGDHVRVEEQHVFAARFGDEAVARFGAAAIIFPHDDAHRGARALRGGDDAGKQGGRARAIIQQHDLHVARRTRKRGQHGRGIVAIKRRQHAKARALRAGAHAHQTFTIRGGHWRYP